MADIPYPRKARRLPKVISPEQVVQLIDSASNAFNHLLLMTLYGTGLRREEVARLRIEDIDRERMVIHVKGGKGRKDRDVMLSPKLLLELDQYLDGLRRRPTTWLFPGNRWHTSEKPVTANVIWNACRDAALRAGLSPEIHPHTLRHYAASRTMPLGSNRSRPRAAECGGGGTPSVQDAA